MLKPAYVTIVNNQCGNPFVRVRKHLHFERMLVFTRLMRGILKNVSTNVVQHLNTSSVGRMAEHLKMVMPRPAINAMYLAKIAHPMNIEQSSDVIIYPELHRLRVRRNFWTELDGFSVYVRWAGRYYGGIPGYWLECATIRRTDADYGSGQLPTFMDRFETTSVSLGATGVVVELVHNERLARWLTRRGYKTVNNDEAWITPTFYKRFTP